MSPLRVHKLAEPVAFACGGPTAGGRRAVCRSTNAAPREVAMGQDRAAADSCVAAGYARGDEPR